MGFKKVFDFSVVSDRREAKKYSGRFFQFGDNKDGFDKRDCELFLGVTEKGFTDRKHNSWRYMAEV